MATADLRATETETDVADESHDETNCFPSCFTNCFAVDYHCLRDVNV